ncbi:hypothetical protein [Polyangium jinanense]|uniref:Uncharacterized protein n=1 Tax=Polyangium jinanense TaxID=2829994 RepID=A0A9X3XFF1_9BACT|nr:hypothetical protein [Polyangium jinanense]MDC3989282.1 hypothetical protein [Polyangium jinanense]
MAKNTYQTYIQETPVDIYRADFLRRGAMCAALATRHPQLADVGAEANAIVLQIDARRTALQSAEDDQVRARAMEDIEKLDVVDVYTELRRTMSAKSYDVAKLLPDAPSTLRRLGTSNFTDRANEAVSNLRVLPENDPIRVAFLGRLEKELAEFRSADKAEDLTRVALQSGRMALTLYKSELSQAREAQLGMIHSILKDREKTALFTLPWRKPARSAEEATPEEAAEEPAAP